MATGELLSIVAKQLSKIVKNKRNVLRVLFQDT